METYWMCMQQQGQQREYFISCPCVPWNTRHLFTWVFFSVLNMGNFKQPPLSSHCLESYTCEYMCVWVTACPLHMSAVCTVHTVHQGQGAALSWDFWWRFPYCLGSCGHGAHSWCCGCPLRRGEIKAGAPCHKGACLVLFNSPKLWPGAKAAPCYGKHFITGTITTAQQDTEGETLNSGRKHSFALSFFFFSRARN